MDLFLIGDPLLVELLHEERQKIFKGGLPSYTPNDMGQGNGASVAPGSRPSPFFR